MGAENHDDMVAAVTNPLRGATVDSGHHMAEDAPEQLASTLQNFLCA